MSGGYRAERPTKAEVANHQATMSRVYDKFPIPGDTLRRWWQLIDQDNPTTRPTAVQAEIEALLGGPP